MEKRKTPAQQKRTALRAAQRTAAAAPEAASDAAAEIAAAVQTDVDMTEVKRQRKAARRAAANEADTTKAKPSAEDPPKAELVEVKKRKKATKIAALEEPVEDPPTAEMIESKKHKKATQIAALAEPAELEVAEEVGVAENGRGRGRGRGQVARTRAAKDAQAQSNGSGNPEITEKKPRDELQVFVGGFSFSCTEDQIREHFGKCGEIKKLNMPLRGGMAQGIAFISFATKEDVDAAIKYDGTEYLGRIIKVNRAGAFSDSNSKRTGETEASSDSKIHPNRNTDDVKSEFTVFVKGLPYSCTEETFRKDFEECGQIQSLKMPIDDVGNSKGFAFVTFVDQVACNNALQHHESEYGGRRLMVKMAGDVPSKGNSKGTGKVGTAKGKKGTGKGKHGKSKENRSDTPEDRMEGFSKRNGTLVESSGTKKQFVESDDE